MTLTQELAQALRDILEQCPEHIPFGSKDRIHELLKRAEPPTSRGSEGEATDDSADMGNHISEQNQLFELYMEMRKFMEDGDPKDFVRVLGEWVNKLSDAISQPYEHVRISDPKRVARLKELASSMGESYRNSADLTPGTLLWHMVKMTQTSQPSAEAWRQAIALFAGRYMWITMAGLDEIETRARELHAASCAKELPK